MKQKSHIIAGLILVLLSSVLYAAEIYFNFEINAELFSGVFFLHYIPTIIYFSVLKFKEEHFWQFFQKDGLTGHILLLVLFNISAYSLNRTIPIFNESSDWLVIFLLVENCLLVAYAMMEKPSRLFQAVICFFFSAALVFNIYQMFMILPASPIGFIAFPFFGISFLLFVPVFYLICIITMLISLIRTTYNLSALIAGFVLTFGIITYYAIEFKLAENLILEARLDQDAPFATDQGLPDWIPVAQVLSGNSFTEKYLKTGLVYQGFSNYDEDLFSSITRSTFKDRYLHDPLVSFSSLFTHHGTLDKKTKLQILNYLYDTRHQTSDRFWSGENLSSHQVVTNVELFPKERLSFTELVITIKNDRNKRSWWRRQQEALYTFDLPEGGVVTSLSLWINGTEEKGILTSKKKAQKAYNTIVGKEMRDPSVVYWMEGNKIRVRVFPCTPQEDRKFKIGVTCPLTLDGEQLTYRSIEFKGPDYSKANSAIHVVAHDTDIISSSIPFKEGASFYSWKGDYKREWQMTMDTPKIGDSYFSFKNENFKVLKTEKKTRNYQPQKVYLDVSNAWTKEELKQIAEISKNIEVLAFTTQFKSKNSIKSIEGMYESALPTFTLFPFHQIDKDQSMIITKGGMATPNLSDLTNTSFKDELFGYFKHQKTAPLVIDIGTEPTDYMKSLKEFGVIEYHAMNLTELNTCFIDGLFPQVNQDPNLVVIPQNGLSISRELNKVGNGHKASDHLMRLFYYQEVLNEIGNNYFTNDKNEYIEEQIVDKAAIANIVTPLSSLIVLESQQDYDRFGIEKNKDSLGNATIGNAGAVPEPHEWAMIIIGMGMLLYIYWKRKTATTLA